MTKAGVVNRIAQEVGVTKKGRGHGGALIDGYN